MEKSEKKRKNTMQQRSIIKDKIIKVEEETNSKSNNEIVFKYRFPEDYNPVYVNGAQGGINPQGEIVANFYFERLALPNRQTHFLNEDGRLGGIKDNDPEDLNRSFVRYVDTGVVMNLQTAKSIFNWLGKQIALVEANLK